MHVACVALSLDAPMQVAILIEAPLADYPNLELIAVMVTAPRLADLALSQPVSAPRKIEPPPHSLSPEPWSSLHQVVAPVLLNMVFFWIIDNLIMRQKPKGLLGNSGEDTRPLLDEDYCCCPIKGTSQR